MLRVYTCAVECWMHNQGCSSCVQSAACWGFSRSCRKEMTPSMSCLEVSKDLKCCCELVYRFTSISTSNNHKYMIQRQLLKDVSFNVTAALHNFILFFITYFHKDQKSGKSTFWIWCCKTECTLEMWVAAHLSGWLLSEPFLHSLSRYGVQSPKNKVRHCSTTKENIRTKPNFLVSCSDSDTCIRNAADNDQNACIDVYQSLCTDPIPQIKKTGPCYFTVSSVALLKITHKSILRCSNDIQYISTTIMLNGQFKEYSP